MAEDRNQEWRRLEKGFPRVSAERRERVEPFLRRTMLVELALFSLCGLTNATLDCVVADRHDVPGLKVGATRRAASDEQALLDDLTVDRRV